MPVSNRAGFGLLLKALARIMYRKVELRILAKIAERREEEMEKLGTRVYEVLNERCACVRGLHFGIFNGMGFPSNKKGERVSPFCWNSPIGISVYIGTSPTIGLGVELRGNVLCIRQMQGVRGEEVPQTIRDWPELLVHACMEHARREGMREVRIYKANQDISFEFPQLSETVKGEFDEDALLAHQSRMRRRYDRTAQKLKFKKRKRYYVWEVPPAQSS